MEERPLALEAVDVSKQYLLGVTGAVTFGDELKRIVHKAMGKADPLAPVEGAPDARSVGKVFHALRNVDFRLHQGEVLGVIGRNGAGKSTLLKLLSRITVPTHGTIRIKGSMSSLLEVGTGFNPELTGRENIYLNAAILGMPRAEIDRQLAPIIAFSGIQHHIDTPVKRYSSGMKVRLGFSVAAHLEPDILVIDEVLAVGDAEFQRKCLGKMKDVATSGRTVLFVSHNMVAIRSLCSRVIWLDEGRVRMDGPTEEVVKAYLATYSDLPSKRSWSPEEAPSHPKVRLLAMELEHDEDGGRLSTDHDFSIRLLVENTGQENGILNVGFQVYTGDDVIAFETSLLSGAPGTLLPLGVHEVRCAIPGGLLNSGDHRLVFMAWADKRMILQAPDTIAFHVVDPPRTGAWFGRTSGILKPRLSWNAQPIAAPSAS